MERLRVVKGADDYTLPERLVILDDGFKIRSKPKDRVFSPGAADISDGEIKEKLVRIEGVIAIDGRSAYVELARRIKQKFYQTDYKLYLGTDYFLNIAKVLNFRAKYLEGGNYNRTRMAIDLLALDPFWYYKTEDSTEETITEDGHSWTVTNNGNVNVYPVITITADTTIANLIIQNETDIPDGEDEGLKFQYQDPAFALTSPSLTVDCQEGTVYRSDTNTIRYFTGAFLKLLPGDNTIKWTGSTLGLSKVKFEFRRRFL